MSVDTVGAGPMIHLALQRSYCGPEVEHAALGATRLGVPYASYDEAPPSTVPVGSVEYCEAALGYYCGAVDLGTTREGGGLTLVEAHHPYACGWYGTSAEAWVLWLLEGWRWTLSYAE